VKLSAGTINDFPKGECRIVELNRRSIGIFHHEDGTLYAVRNRCPHHGGPLCRGKLGGTMLPSAPGEHRYGLEGFVLRCPWHGWEFDIRTGRPLFDIDRSRVAVYEVSVEEGEVFVEVKG